MRFDCKGSREMRVAVLAFPKSCAGNIKICATECGIFFEVCKLLRVSRQFSPWHQKCCACHTDSLYPKSKMTTVSPNKTFEPFNPWSPYPTSPDVVDAARNQLHKCLPFSCLSPSVLATCATHSRRMQSVRCPAPTTTTPTKWT